jgi:hypothetical protein
MEKRKVFCLGWQKTGTTSFRNATKLLGYRTCGYMKAWTIDDLRDRMGELMASTVPKYDSFSDNPWPVLFERLDAAYPGSLFVLTTRPPEAWIRSVVQHFGDADIPMHRFIYGDQFGRAKGNEDYYVETMLKHNDAVRRYFAGRDDFLELKLVHGAGWETLCPFLGVAPPAEPFPHANKGSARTWKRLKAIPGKLWHRIGGNAPGR